ncbi:MAG: hypothetical protein QW751_01075 [Candidatus Aenigmatarchaeota archaeon]|nr:hypothetical protein [Candidatus Aenigmarchaeota archaeon]
MKGIEGLPLRYILLLLIAAVVLVAVLSITGMLTTSATSATQTANSSLLDVLSKSIGNVLVQNPSP